MLFASHRVAGRLTIGPHDITDFDLRTPLFEVPFEVDLGKDRVANRFGDPRDDLEYAADRLVLA